jgi:hypothetical protein
MHGPGFDSHTAPYTVKMVSDIPVPSCNVNYQILPGPNDSIVSDIPAGDGNVANLFYNLPSVHRGRYLIV